MPAGDRLISIGLDGEIEPTAEQRIQTLAQQAATAVGATKADSSALAAHTGSTANPHATTKAQVGLGSVDNIAATALRDRATHTGSQVSTTISDFTEAVQDAVAALLGAGSNITLNYDDAGNLLTVTSAGGTGGTFDPEAVRDTIGVALLGTGLISVVINDAADTITLSTTATQNSTDAALRARASHTGTQPLSSVDTLVLRLDDLDNEVAVKADETHTHDASVITTGFLSLERLPPGAMFTIKWNPTLSVWQYNSVTITTRPTSRTNLRMVMIGPTSTPAPFAIADDLHLSETA